MNKATVEPDCTGQFSSFFMDYIRQKPALSPFFNQFPKIENFAKIIEERKFDVKKREVLVKVLLSQYSEVENKGQTIAQIEKLGYENTFSVTTGHQLNLFTGPLYFIYKIVTTINLAQKLKETYPKFDFVPVYWMASEDHDFDEINYFKLDGKKYQWQTEQKGPVGDFKLEESFKEFMKTVTFAPSFLKEAYLSSNTLSEAVRKYVHHLFGEKGLVVVDGNDTNFKRQFIPVIREDLTQGSPHDLVNVQTAKLDALGYKSQIFPRPINFFYMEAGLRERIEKKGEQYFVLNTDLKFEEEEFLAMVENSPEKFSPNVVLRPLYQEQILPNLAYVGGPAEVIYWLQLKSMFDHFETPFPAVMPRNFAAVLDAPIVKKIKKLNLSHQDLFRDFTDWKKEYVSKHSNVDIHLDVEKKQLAEVFEHSTMSAKSIDPTLENAFASAKVRTAKILEQLSVKVRKAEERKFNEELDRMKAIQAYLSPGGSPQERVENFLKFYLSDNDFVEKLFDLFDPFDFDFMVLTPDDK